MPIIGLNTNNLDFQILEDLDPKTISIWDKSSYVDTFPTKPALEIVPPGFNKSFVVPFKPFDITVVNANQLGIGCGDNVNMPDGVYCITLKVVPYADAYHSVHYLKTDLLQYEIDEKLLTVISNRSVSEDYKQKFLDLDLFIKAGKAHARAGNINEATSLYQKAQNIVKKIKCRK